MNMTSLIMGFILGAVATFFYDIPKIVRRSNT